MRLSIFRGTNFCLFGLFSWMFKRVNYAKENKSGLPGPTLTLFAKLVSIVSKATAIFNFDTTRIKIKRINSILPLFLLPRHKATTECLFSIYKVNRIFWQPWALAFKICRTDPVTEFFSLNSSNLSTNIKSYWKNWPKKTSKGAFI